jgi:hypothetical protein
LLLLSSWFGLLLVERAEERVEHQLAIVLLLGLASVWIWLRLLLPHSEARHEVVDLLELGLSWAAVVSRLGAGPSGLRSSGLIVSGGLLPLLLSERRPRG